MTTAMSEAVEGAEVMLYGVSLQYKESANVSARGYVGPQLLTWLLVDLCGIV